MKDSIDKIIKQPRLKRQSEFERSEDYIRSLRESRDVYIQRIKEGFEGLKHIDLYDINNEEEAYLRHNLKKILNETQEKDKSGKRLIEYPIIKILYDRLLSYKSYWLYKTFAEMSDSIKQGSILNQKYVWQQLSILGEQIDNYESADLASDWRENKQMVLQVTSHPLFANHPYTSKIRQKLLAIDDHHDGSYVPMDVHDPRFKSIHRIGKDFLATHSNINIDDLGDDWLAKFKNCIEAIKKSSDGDEVILKYMDFIYEEERKLWTSNSLHIPGSVYMYMAWSLVDKKMMSETSLLDIWTEAATAYQHEEGSHYSGQDYSCHPGNEERLLVFSGLLAKSLIPDDKKGVTLWYQEYMGQYYALLSNYIPSWTEFRPGDLAINPSIHRYIELCAVGYMGDDDYYFDNDENVEKVAKEIYEKLCRQFEPISEGWMFDIIFSKNNESAKDVLLAEISSILRFTSVEAVDKKEVNELEDKFRESIDSLKRTYLVLYSKLWPMLTSNEVSTLSGFEAKWIYESQDVKGINNSEGDSLLQASFLNAYILKQIITKVKLEELKACLSDEVNSIKPIYLLLKNSDEQSFLDVLKILQKTLDNKLYEQLLFATNLYGEGYDESYGESLLILATKKGYIDVACEILRHEHCGLEVLKQHNQYDINALMYACSQAYVEVVKEILKHKDFNSDVLMQQDTCGQNALMYALDDNSRETLKALLSHPDCSTDLLMQQDETGKNVLIMACEERDEYAVMEIINNEHCTDKVLAQQDNDSRSPLTIALEKGDDEIACAIISHKNCPASLLDSPFNNQKNLLFYAIRLRDSILEAVLSSPYCDDQLLSQVDKQGKNALMAALSKGETTLFKAILNHPCCDLSILKQTDKEDMTILLHAVKNHAPSMITAVLNHRCFTKDLLKQCNSDGCNALMLAVKSANVELLQEILAQQECDEEVLNLCDSQGLNILMNAISENQTQIIHTILSCSAFNIDMLFNKNSSGDSPLSVAIDLATKSHDTSMLEVLLCQDKFRNDLRKKHQPGIFTLLMQSFKSTDDGAIKKSIVNVLSKYKVLGRSTRFKLFFRGYLGLAFTKESKKPQTIAIENNQGHRRLSSKNLYKNREPVAPNSSTKMPSLFGQSIEKR